MKKLVILALAASMLLLTGCGAIYSQYRDLEGLRIVETMGIDSAGGAVRLSVATAGGIDEPLKLTASGASISTAMQRVESLCAAGELFFSHTDSIVIGSESARGGLQPLEDFICRSPQVRTDVDIFIVSGDTAEAALTDTGDDSEGVCELIEKLQKSADTKSGPYIYAAAEIIDRLAKYGAVPVYLLSLEEASDGETKTLVHGGYGILKDSALIDTIPESCSPALAILENKAYLTDVKLEGGTLQLEEGSSTLSPIWDDEDQLSGIELKLNVEASILESESGDIDALRHELEQALLRDTTQLIRLSKKHSADYLALAGRIEAADAGKFRRMERSFTELLPELRFTVSVSAKISHTNDVKSGGGA